MTPLAFSGSRHEILMDDDVTSSTVTFRGFNGTKNYNQKTIDN